jgi:hypothetical protein
MSTLTSPPELVRSSTSPATLLNTSRRAHAPRPASGSPCSDELEPELEDTAGSVARRRASAIRDEPGASGGDQRRLPAPARHARQRRAAPRQRDATQRARLGQGTHAPGSSSNRLRSTFLGSSSRCSSSSSLQVQRSSSSSTTGRQWQHSSSSNDAPPPAAARRRRRRSRAQQPWHLRSRSSRRLAAAALAAAAYAAAAERAAQQQSSSRAAEQRGRRAR